MRFYYQKWVEEQAQTLIDKQGMCMRVCVRACVRVVIATMVTPTCLYSIVTLHAVLDKLNIMLNDILTSICIPPLGTGRVKT